MKRILILLAVAALSLQAFAQTTLPGDIFVKASVNFHSVTGKDIQTMDNLGLGYRITFGMEKPLGTSDQLFYQYEFGLGTRGSWSVDNEGGISTDSKMVNHAMQVGLNLVYRIGVGGNQSLDLHAGIGWTMDIFGKSKSEATMGGETYKNEVKLKDYGSGFRRSDIYFSPGITFWLGNFGIDFAWQRGFIAMAQDTDTCASNILMGIAYRF